MNIMLVFVCFLFRLILANTTMLGYNHETQCEEFVCRHGYKYDTFFSVDGIRKPNNSNVLFEMHIEILAPSNGHIVLSHKPHPGPTDDVYEIVVGGGANKFTELRRNLRRNAKASNRTIDILSPTEFRPFYIRMNEDGTIEFGRYTDPLPILSYFDVSPIPIRFFSFAAWTGVEAKFRFDCPFPNENTSKSSSKSEPVKRNLTNIEQLKQNLLYGRISYLQPAPITVVNFGTEIKYIHYDPVDSILTTGLSIVMRWVDDSLAWNPDKFFNITYAMFPEGQLWQPKLFVVNSVSATPLEHTFTNPPILLLNSGDTFLQFDTEVKSYCMINTDTYSRWPRDEYICYLVIQPWEAHEKFIMTVIEDTNVQTGQIPGVGEVTKNDWEWSSSAKVVNASDWNQVMYNSYNDSTMHTSDRIIIAMHLKRKAATYNVVFYTPLLVLITFVLMSFWTEPLNMSRVWFYIGVSMVLCMELCYIDDLLPSSKIPFILIFYITVLSGVLIALLIQVFLMTSAVKNWCNYRSDQIKASSLLRILFCVPQMKTCHTYETVESCSFENDTSGNLYESTMDNVEELQRDHIEYDARTILAECIDKFMFFIYSVAIAVMLAKAAM